MGFVVTFDTPMQYTLFLSSSSIDSPSPKYSPFCFCFLKLHTLSRLQVALCS